MTLRDLPATVDLNPGEIRVTGANAEEVLEGLVVLAQVMQNDLESVRMRLDPPFGQGPMDEELRNLFAAMRHTDSSVAQNVSNQSRKANSLCCQTRTFHDLCQSLTGSCTCFLRKISEMRQQDSQEPSCLLRYVVLDELKECSGRHNQDPEPLGSRIPHYQQPHLSSPGPPSGSDALVGLICLMRSFAVAVREPKPNASSCGSCTDMLDAPLSGQAGD